MDQKLFRQQALDQHTSRLYGRVLVLPHPSHHLLIAGLLLWLAAAGFWLSQASYTDKKIMQGQLQLTNASDSFLEAKLEVPAYAASLLHEGQLLDIHYDAFPYQIYGSDIGEIVSITEAEKNQSITREPTYHIGLKMQPTNLFVKGKPLQLRDGMRFSTEIMLGKQSLISWLFSREATPL